MALAWAQAQQSDGDGKGSAVNALLFSSASGSSKPSSSSCPAKALTSEVTPEAPGDEPVGAEMTMKPHHAAAAPTFTSATAALVAAGVLPDEALPVSARSGNTSGVARFGGGNSTGVSASDYVIVLTMCLPDGQGDLIFGVNAVLELMELLPVVWIRCYTNDESAGPGEALVAEVAGKVRRSIVCSNQQTLHETLGSQSQLQALWTGARARFLAPWIFGLSVHEEVLLRLAQSTGTPFWALTEYGRSMGNIHTYTYGLGTMIPTGWDESGGVFQSIKRATQSDTNWKSTFARYCGLPVDSPAAPKVRLWWFYSRKDDEKKHDFRVIDREKLKGGAQLAAPHVHLVSKVIPIDAKGNLALAHEKTSGEKLADQLFQVANDPNFKPTTNVTDAEVAAGNAGQLTQFLWGVLLDPSFTPGVKTKDDGSADHSGFVDIVVAPNIFTKWRKESAEGWVAARVARLDLTNCVTGETKEVPVGFRNLYVVSARIPRPEIRSFLEQSEERCYTTGDQSLSEAVLLGKIPCVRPDAKVNQWQAALLARAQGKVNEVPDLGDLMRNLCAEGPEADALRQEMRQASQRRSAEVERQIVAQLGGAPPETWNPTQQVMARAGMLG